MQISGKIIIGYFYTYSNQIFTILWWLLAKIYDFLGWILGYLANWTNVLWLKLGRKQQPVWNFFDKFFKVINFTIIIPLNRIISTSKKLLDRSELARALFFIATPVIIICTFWPPWDWGYWYAQQSGIASYYGQGFYFKRTANGELFLPGPFFTAAHKNLPFGTKVLVVDQKTGRSVVVIINDRGPYVGKRIIDLSVAAALRLGIYHQGIAKVTLYTRHAKGERILYYPFR